MKGFSSTDQYIATDELIEAVNASITLEKPLLIKGEPGTGKTKLAEEIALKFNTDLIKWNIKSTTKAHQGLYEYDAVSRLRDSQHKRSNSVCIPKSNQTNASNDHGYSKTTLTSFVNLFECLENMSII